jgi:hypothetical protein
MDLERVLAELRKERDAIESAIFSLERLGRSGNTSPGRHPGLAAKSPTNGVNGNHGNHRSASLAPGEESS